MHKHVILIIIFLIPFFFACRKKGMAKTTGKSKQISISKPVVQEPADTIPLVKSAIVDPETDMTNTGSPYSVDSMKIEGDTLSVFVNYSGGCKKHSFDLYSNGMYAKSLPPQLTVNLKHNGYDDGCRKLIMEEVKFDVSNLKYAGKNTVILKLSDQRITYSTSK